MQRELARRLPQRYAWRVKRWGAAGVLWLAISALAAAHPSFVPTDPPVALVQTDPGRSTFTLVFDASGWTATLSRSVTDVCAVVVILTPSSLFEIRVRALVLPSLYPLRMALELGRDQWSLFGALHLGPVRLVGDRGWGKDAYARIAMHGSKPGVAASAGAVLDGGLGPFISVTWFPDAVPLSSLTLVVTSDRWRIAIGGTW